MISTNRRRPSGGDLAMVARVSDSMLRVSAMIWESVVCLFTNVYYFRQPLAGMRVDVTNIVIDQPHSQLSQRYKTTSVAYVPVNQSKKDNHWQNHIIVNPIFNKNCNLRMTGDCRYPQRPSHTSNIAK